MSIFILSSFRLNASEPALKPFYTDGCTLFVDGTPKRPGLWKHCCIEHDLRYWFGGELIDRDNMDLSLKQCVNEVAGSKWAELIYNGVRAGHNSPVKSKTFWGWGWTTERKDSPLTDSEIIYVKSELRKLPFNADYIEAFITRYLPRE